VAKILNTEVLIVGAGPTGLMAANQLARFGIDFIIVDKKSGPTKESRAIAVTARSLEIYQQMGIVHHALEGGKAIKSFYLYSQGKQKAEVKIGEIGKGLSEFSYMLAFEQSKNEELLASNLHRQNKMIHWNHEFIEVTEYKEGIRARVQREGEETTIIAQYLIACDGANSAVRQQLKFSYEGGTYDQRFFVADTVMHWDFPYDRLVIAPGDHYFCAFLPLYGHNGYRVIGSLPLKYADIEEIAFHDIDNEVIRAIGIKLKFESINWFATYKLHHRGVDHFREHRIFLAGDSAHIHSPAGGQGMNTGLQDVYNLCWKLSLVLRNQANRSLLDTYNEERLPFARWLLKFTDRAFNAMTSDNWFVRFGRKYIAFNLAGLLVANRKIRPVIFKILSQIWYSYNGKSLSRSLTGQSVSFRAGDRLPFFPEENIYPLFTEACFHLLHIHSESLSTEIQERVKRTFPFPVKIIERTSGSNWKKLGVRKELFILVRPDNYIALIFDSFNETGMNDYLKRHFR
jgi:2-polyprenyl-6-methoxyphenol hydroxylase-like FAD-dependent oxidoreductase